MLVLQVFSNQGHPPGVEFQEARCATARACANARLPRLFRIKRHFIHDSMPWEVLANQFLRDSHATLLC